VFGVFDVALPTKEQLRSWGLNVRDDYKPELHRSHIGVDDDAVVGGAAEGTSDPSAGWVMSWPEVGRDV
jgi:hypothetical protein